MAREALSDNERWRLWWNANYSWEGLGKTEWLGWRIGADGIPKPESDLSATEAETARRATLQDYWRDQETALIDELDDDGQVVRRWTKVHLPVEFQNGAATKKHGYAAEIVEIVKARLAVAAETPGQYGECEDMVRWWPEREDRRANFEGAVLPSFVASDLIHGPVHIRLSGAVILGQCDCNGANFGAGAEFHYTRFLGDSDFKRAVFEGVCTMGFAQFKRNCEFGNAHFKGNADFFGTDYEADCAFDNCTFEGEAQFTFGRVVKTMSFGDSHFHQPAFFFVEVGGNANFVRCQFNDRAIFILECAGRAFFDYSTFSGTTTFGASTFGGMTRFVDVKFPSIGALPMRRGFHATQFKDQVDFSGSGAHWTYALFGAIIEGDFLLDDIGGDNCDAAARRYFRTISTRETIAAINKRAAPTDAPTTREVLLREFEDSCRVVKVAMGRSRNETLEQRYYRHQLIARRRQSSAPVWERLLSFMYACFGDYGNSMLRPIIGLALSVAAFGLMYYAWSSALWPSANSTINNGSLEAMQFSLANTFRPLSALDSQSHYRGSMSLALTSDSWWGFWFRVTAVLQSLFAITLAFLFGLAVRRRFQMH